MSLQYFLFLIYLCSKLPEYYYCTSVCVHVPYQRVEIVADQGSVVDDISFEDNEEEEESQHHVTKVTEDVVERAVYESAIKSQSYFKTQVCNLFLWL